MFLEISQKFTGKHLCQSLFFNKVAGAACKKRLCHRCFPVNFAKFVRTPFFTEHLRWLQFGFFVQAQYISTFFSQLFVAELLPLRPIRSFLYPFCKRSELKESLILAHYRSEIHFKHNILSLRKLSSFQSDKNYRTGVNQA